MCEVLVGNYVQVSPAPWKPEASDPLDILEPELQLWAAWCGYWESNLGLPEEHQVIFNSELSLQLLIFTFKDIFYSLKVTYTYTMYFNHTLSPLIPALPCLPHQAPSLFYVFYF